MNTEEHKNRIDGNMPECTDERYVDADGCCDGCCCSRHYVTIVTGSGSDGKIILTYFPSRLLGETTYLHGDEVNGEGVGVG